MIDKFLLLKVIASAKGSYWAIGLFWNEKFGWQGNYNRNTKVESNAMIEIDEDKFKALSAKLNGPVALILDAKCTGVNQFRLPVYDLIVK